MDESNDGEEQNLAFFAEKDAVIELIDMLSKEPISDDLEACYQKISKYLGKYQEQPLLILPFMNDLLSPVSEQLRLFVANATNALQLVRISYQSEFFFVMTPVYSAIKDTVLM
jgi:hypothetical protein